MFPGIAYFAPWMVSPWKTTTSPGWQAQDKRSCLPSSISATGTSSYFLPPTSTSTWKHYFPIIPLPHRSSPCSFSLLQTSWGGTNDPTWRFYSLISLVIPGLAHCCTIFLWDLGYDIKDQYQRDHLVEQLTLLGQPVRAPDKFHSGIKRYRVNRHPEAHLVILFEPFSTCKVRSKRSKRCEINVKVKLSIRGVELQGKTNQATTVDRVVRLVLVPRGFLLSSWFTKNCPFIFSTNNFSTRIRWLFGDRKVLSNLNLRKQTEQVKIDHFPSTEVQRFSFHTRFLIQDMLMVENWIGRSHHLGRYLRCLQYFYFFLFVKRIFSSIFAGCQTINYYKSCLPLPGTQKQTGGTPGFSASCNSRWSKSPATGD